MRSKSITRGTLAFLVATSAVLITGFWSLDLIPFYEPFWGLDFQNLHAFQSCPGAHAEGIYAVSGSSCGDALGRDFIYPPSLFRIFFWADAFSFETAISIWNVAMVVLMGIVGITWAWLDGLHEARWKVAFLALFWVLLLGQFPFVFALERGNNDVIPVALWTLSAAFFASRNYAVSGGWAGFAAALKIYPAVGFFLVALGAARQGRKIAVPLILGGVSGGVLLSIFWLDDTILYLTEVLPDFAQVASTLPLISHTFISVSSSPFFFGGMALLLIGSWSLAAWKRLPRDPTIVFAGGLAISTYFSTVSWDYNLITTYPLLFIVTSRALDERSGTLWRIASVAAILSITSGRALLDHRTQLFLQVSALVLVAWLIAFDPAMTASEHPGEHGANATRSRVSKWLAR